MWYQDASYIPNTVTQYEASWLCAKYKGSPNCLLLQVIPVFQGRPFISQWLLKPDHCQPWLACLRTCPTLTDPVCYLASCARTHETSLPQEHRTNWVLWVRWGTVCSENLVCFGQQDSWYCKGIYGFVNEAGSKQTKKGSSQGSSLLEDKMLRKADTLRFRQQPSNHFEN